MESSLASGLRFVSKFMNLQIQYAVTIHKATICQRLRHRRIKVGSQAPALLSREDVQIDRTENPGHHDRLIHDAEKIQIGAVGIPIFKQEPLRVQG